MAKPQLTAFNFGRDRLLETTPMWTGRHNLNMTTTKTTTYIDTLDTITRRRYEDKISLIDGLDPYELDNTTLDSGHSGLPSITNRDIMNYLVNTVSAYLLEQFKAYETLKSYNSVDG